MEMASVSQVLFLFLFFDQVASLILMESGLIFRNFPIHYKYSLTPLNINHLH